MNLQISGAQNQWLTVRTQAGLLGSFQPLLWTESQDPPSVVRSIRESKDS